jgi:aconitate hydratase
VKGGTGSIIEYFGPGVSTLSCTGMATICNMGAETGATTSLFPYTKAMGDYLEATDRAYIRDAAQAWSQNLAADPGAEYDRIININLSEIEPFINGPSTPDLATPNSQFKELVSKNKWPRPISAGLIGSCTNSSFEDMSRAADLAKQALEAGLKPKAPLILSPGSEQTKATLEAAGILETFEQLNASLLANACGPCCGSWSREDVEKVRSNFEFLGTIHTDISKRVLKTRSLLHTTETSRAVLTVTLPPPSSSPHLKPSSRRRLVEL